ncbi:MAG: hypothetical protein L0227_04090 [Chloroflexi bacterium]|nr:hypothetical protein [Chloroflexota bacterium]
MTDRTELLAALETVSSAFTDVRTATAGGERTWTRAGAAIAILGGDGVELRIGAAIAAAAVRTPDVSTSARGADWVVFAPGELDGHALDRLGAWFAAAHRRAAG